MVLAGRSSELCETVGDGVKFPTEYGGAGIISRVELNPSLIGEVADSICIKWRLWSCARVFCSGHRVSHLHKIGYHRAAVQTGVIDNDRLSQDQASRQLSGAYRRTI